jgi:hypothetical protein
MLVDADLVEFRGVDAVKPVFDGAKLDGVGVGNDRLNGPAWAGQKQHREYRQNKAH